jgi:hypothetical protein
MTFLPNLGLSIKTGKPTVEVVVNELLVNLVSNALLRSIQNITGSQEKVKSDETTNKNMNLWYCSVVAKSRIVHVVVMIMKNILNLTTSMVAEQKSERKESSMGQFVKSKNESPNLDYCVAGATI